MALSHGIASFLCTPRPWRATQPSDAWSAHVFRGRVPRACNMCTYLAVLLCEQHEAALLDRLRHSLGGERRKQNLSRGRSRW